MLSSDWFSWPSDLPSSPRVWGACRPRPKARTLGATSILSSLLLWRQNRFFYTLSGCSRYVLKRKLLTLCCIKVTLIFRLQQILQLKMRGERLERSKNNLVGFFFGIKSSKSLPAESSFTPMRGKVRKK